MTGEGLLKSRMVRIVCILLAALVMAACALFQATTPHIVITIVLLVGGCTRSLQFTSLNAISYADVSQREMSQATSMASVAQQLSVSLGVTVGAYSLQLSQFVRGGAVLDATDFHIAFVVVSAIALSSTLYFQRLDPDAGAELAGRPRAMVAAETSDVRPQS